MSMGKFRPNLVISDWDETITVHDTIQNVAQVPYIANPNLEPKFSHYSKIYIDNYASYESQFGPLEKLNDYVRFQKGMRPIEMSSISALEKDLIFKGLKPDQFREQAIDVVLRPGVIEFIKMCQEEKIPFIILSVNWTSLIIEQVLKMHGVEEINIITNEFEFHDGETTGFWLSDQVVRTSEDKLRFVKKLAKGEDKVMYIGDSLTDLLPILFVKYPCAIENTKLNNFLSIMKIDHVTGNWLDFIEKVETK
ncbi:hypothetical protein KGF56_004305 [Candida oxycetoniae]|uniref:Uncharacterized protein n=1 Tax=Candida oxycetoniae TaxID=497107 RepID=A0AAI9WWK7_9ASCO|nr:uncharacterized protein KGF56_004305 [Candida oxycetoniae]KAI3402844.2 hypothetical protein KGF56_004305 [Candida oxycetoniae]